MNVKDDFPALPAVVVSVLAIATPFAMRSQWLLVVAMIPTGLILGFFSYSLVAAFVEDKPLWFNCTLSIVAVFVVYGVFYAFGKCGCSMSEEEMEHLEREIEYHEPKW